MKDYENSALHELLELNFERFDRTTQRNETNYFDE
jgi:hypothetical protein